MLEESWLLPKQQYFLKTIDLQIRHVLDDTHAAACLLSEHCAAFECQPLPGKEGMVLTPRKVDYHKIQMFKKYWYCPGTGSATFFFLVQSTVLPVLHVKTDIGALSHIKTSTVTFH